MPHRPYLSLHERYYAAEQGVPLFVRVAVNPWNQIISIGHFQVADTSQRLLEVLSMARRFEPPAISSVSAFAELHDSSPYLIRSLTRI